MPAKDGARRHGDQVVGAWIFQIAEHQGRSVEPGSDAKGAQVALRFNYKDVMQGKNLKQNIELKPGDTIIVP